MEEIFQPCEDAKGMFFQFYEIYQADCQRRNILADSKQMFGQIMSLKFPTYRLKSTGSKASQRENCIRCQTDWHRFVPIPGTWLTDTFRQLVAIRMRVKQRRRRLGNFVKNELQTIFAKHIL